LSEGSISPSNREEETVISNRDSEENEEDSEMTISFNKSCKSSNEDI